jgi:hypothetical protein
MRIFGIGFGVIAGGWLLFDGLRAAITGAYTTFGRGEHAGQLGPWARIVATVGLSPTGKFIIAVHILLGILWLAGSAQLSLPHPAWRLLVVAAVATLWYMPVGTAIAIAVLLLAYMARAQAQA